MDRPGLISVSKLMQKSIGPYQIAENTTLKIYTIPVSERTVTRNTRI